MAMRTPSSFSTNEYNHSRNSSKYMSHLGPLCLRNVSPCATGAGRLAQRDARPVAAETMQTRGTIDVNYRRRQRRGAYALDDGTAQGRRARSAALKAAIRSRKLS